MATVIKISKADYIEIERDLMQLETDGAGQLDVEYEIIREPPDLEATAELKALKNYTEGSFGTDSNEEIEEDVEEVVKR